MKHITILVPKGAILGSVEGPRQVFTEVNNFLKRLGKVASTLFTQILWQTISPKQI
jgi:hypothetical protein